MVLVSHFQIIGCSTAPRVWSPSILGRTSVPNQMSYICGCTISARPRVALHTLSNVFLLPGSVRTLRRSIPSPRPPSSLVNSVSSSTHLPTSLTSSLCSRCNSYRPGSRLPTHRPASRFVSAPSRSPSSVDLIVYAIFLV